MSGPGNTPNTILHIGAGTGSELDEWLATGARRVILVEPNPERARELATRAATDERIEVVQKAVAAEGGQLRLKRFNLPAFSSLREPTGLLELLPGLRTDREIDVDTITPTELLETVPLAEDGHHWLIIDAPGEEEAIVNELCAIDEFAHFNRLILHCGADPLYSDNVPVATLLDRLQEAGYDIEQQDDTDPDRPCWSLRRNPLRLENQTLRDQVAELEQQAKELTASRDELEREAEERKQAQEALKQEKEGLAQKNGELEQQAKELEKSRDKLRTAKQEADQARERAEAERDAAHTERENLCTAKEEADRAREQAEGKLDSLDGLTEKVDDLEAKIRDCVITIDQKNSSIQDLENKVQILEATNSGMEAELVKAEGQIALVKDLVSSSPDT